MTGRLMSRTKTPRHKISTRTGTMTESRSERDLTTGCPEITFVIPSLQDTTKDPAWLRRCIESILELDDCRCEVIVVDDASPVEIDVSDFPAVRCIRLSNRGGFGRAANIGAREAS